MACDTMFFFLFAWLIQFLFFLNMLPFHIVHTYHLSDCGKDVNNYGKYKNVFTNFE